MRYSAGGDGLVGGALALVGATVTWVVAGPEVAPQVLALSVLPCTIALAGAGLVLLVAALTVHRRRTYLAAWIGAGLLLMTGIGGLVGETWRALGAPDGGWLATVPLAALVIHVGLDRADGGRIGRATATLLLAAAGLVTAGPLLEAVTGVPAWEVQAMLCAAALASLAWRCARHPLLPEEHRAAVVGGIAALAADSVLAVGGMSGAWFIPQAAVAVGGTVALLSVAWRWTIDATRESDARVDELVGDLEEQRAEALHARTALHDARAMLAGLRAAADALALDPAGTADRRELEATDTLVAAAGVQGYDFLDEATTANALVPILKRRGVEAIVVLLHEGGSQTPPPGEIDACVGISGPIVAINDALDPEIDAIVTGHTHLPYNCRLPDAAGQPRLVTSAYSYGRVVSELDLVLDKRTDDVRRDLSLATNHAVVQSELAPDPAITAVLDKWAPLYASAGTTPVGTITADINRGGVGGSDRGVESPVGNLVADSMLWATSASGADVAFMNPGGLRADLTYAQSTGEGDGVVTFAEAFALQPFGNTLVTYAMTGAQILSVLEQQCQPAGSARPFLHLGVSAGFTYDLARTITGGNCTSVTVTNVRLNGVPLDPNAAYDVTVNNFLADGGDNFTTFATVTSPRLDGGSDLTALTGYLGAFSPVAPPSTDRVNELP